MSALFLWFLCAAVDVTTYDMLGRRIPGSLTVSARPVSLGEVAPAGSNLAIRTVCDELNIDPDDLVSTDRHAPLPYARKLVAWLLWLHDWTPDQIGRLIGREESTVRYYLRSIEIRRRREWETLNLCSRLRLRYDRTGDF